MSRIATERAITVAVGRKVSRDYNSTEIRLELTLDLDVTENADELMSATAKRLTERIKLIQKGQ